MLVQNKSYDVRVWNLHYLIQSSWAKQRDNPLHKMNLPAEIYSHINVLRQVKLINNKAIRGDLDHSLARILSTKNEVQITS